MEASEKTIVSNRKAFSDYAILEKYEAGILLSGPEVKSAREARVNLKDSYVLVKKEEAFLLNCHISPYAFAYDFPQEPTRTRNLLLHKAEIRRLMGKVNEKGLTMVPLRMYLKGKHVKVEIALVKAKKIWGKREEKRRKAVEKE